MGKTIIPTPNTILYHTFLADYQGCGYIRCQFPSMMLSQYNHNNRLRVFPFSNMAFINDLSYYKQLLFVIFQRSATFQQLQLIKYFKKNFKHQTKTPMLYEIDDLLTEIPKWNFAYDYYDKCKNHAIEIMKTVDGMIVSTKKLKEVYSQYNQNIKVSENHLIKTFWGDPKWKETENKIPRVLWAGSGNHFSQTYGVKGGDFSNTFMDYIKSTKGKIQWVFVGGYPIELENVDNVEFHEWVDIFNYPAKLKSLKIDLAIAPLEYNLFNRCKSNIKALEYTAAGIPAIYSKIDPYHNMPLQVDQKLLWSDVIEEIIFDKDKLKRLWENSYKAVENQMFWTEKNICKHFNTLLGLIDLKLPK